MQTCLNAVSLTHMPFGFGLCQGWLYAPPFSYYGLGRCDLLLQCPFMSVGGPSGGLLFQCESLIGPCARSPVLGVEWPMCLVQQVELDL